MSARMHAARAALPLSALAAALLLGGCAGTPSPDALDRDTERVMQASFRSEGIATVDRLVQDDAQKACSAATPPSPEVAERIQAAAMASVKWPADGRFLGDWKEGEKLAQSGRGMTWTDAAGTSTNGANCYNCHQISKTELSFGTIGPSLLQYGRLRGVTDPASAQALPIVRYTWAKIWNAKATNACSAMPRLGHVGALNEAQIRDVMALLLDPRSPVNAP